MATKIETFLKEKKIDPRRILVASAQIERLRREDRGLRLAQRRARKSEDGGKKKEGAEVPPKPRSGRPVTLRALSAALAGKPISGPTKTRILRALNHVLGQKKLGEATLGQVFDAPKKKA